MNSLILTALIEEARSPHSLPSPPPNPSMTKSLKDVLYLHFLEFSKQYNSFVPVYIIDTYENWDLLVELDKKGKTVSTKHIMFLNKIDVCFIIYNLFNMGYSEEDIKSIFRDLYIGSDVETFAKRFFNWQKNSPTLQNGCCT